MLEKLSIKFANLVITTNKSFRDRFILRGCPPEKIRIILNSPQEDIFKLREYQEVSHRQDKGSFKVMFHGSILERSGLDIAVHAIDDLRSKINNLEFLIYGKGEFKDVFLSLIEELKIGNTVRYFGVVSLEELVLKINEADVGLIPNRLSPFTNINLPTRIMEFLSQSKPVIAPRTQGILDYFDDESLVLFEPDNFDDLCKSILYVYNNPREVLKKVERGVELYKKYRWNEESKNLTEYYSQLFE